MWSRGHRCVRSGVGFVVACALAVCTAAAVTADGTIVVDNRSGKRIKATAPGGSAVVEADAAPTPIRFESAEPVGVTLQIWWVARPRQLCRIFTPWDRTVTVTATAAAEIHCRSQSE